ncbi:MAG: sigma-70 family RNA polymerase sigma factor [Muribaculaceae bacterium]|nr:sigma-70 family RNA polymerase sigma factor [Muribaculaceae bacterium]
MCSTERRQKQFISLLDEYKNLIVKVCYVYSSPSVSVDDLYQEVAANIWTGLDKFRGDAKISTWIYRTAINTCITYLRHNRHSSLNTPIEDAMMIADDGDSSRMERYRQLHALIAGLQPLEKAIVTLWLDEKPYAEIANITGLSVPGIATRLHRIKDKLAQKAQKE